MNVGTMHFFGRDISHIDIVQDFVGEAGDRIGDLVDAKNM